MGFVPKVSNFLATMGKNPPVSDRHNVIYTMLALTFPCLLIGAGTTPAQNKWGANSGRDNFTANLDGM